MSVMARKYFSEEAAVAPFEVEEKKAVFMCYEMSDTSGLQGTAAGIGMTSEKI
jgi:hypothetical protein